METGAFLLLWGVSLVEYDAWVWCMGIGDTSSSMDARLHGGIVLRSKGKRLHGVGALQ